MTPEEIREFEHLKGEVSSNTKEIAELKEEAKKIKDKQDMMYEMNQNIALMAQSQQRMEENMEDIKEDVGNLSAEVQEIKNAPAQEMLQGVKKIQWNVVSTIAVSIATGIAGYVIAYVLSK